MGIPFYVKYLLDKYGREGFKLDNNTALNLFNNRKVFSLSIDFNSLIHSAAAKAYKYGEYKLDESSPEFRDFNKKTTEQKEKDHFEYICKEIEDLCFMIKPQNTLILAVDGPACLGKQYQQRQRRFKARSKVVEVDEKKSYLKFSTVESNSTNFDTNAITPGTTYMERMNEFIKNWLSNYQTTKSKYINSILQYKKDLKDYRDGSYFNKIANYKKKIYELEDRIKTMILPPNIIYSSHREPGEGEHKISKYLRQMTNINTNQKHIVVGLDADLFMLGLLSPVKNYMLYRGEVERNGYYEHNLFDIDYLRYKVSKEIDIKDFVLLNFLAGNDFLPSLPSVNIDTKDIDTILDSYKSGSYNKDKIVNKDNTINWVNFKRFIDRFSLNEEQLLLSHIKNGWANSYYKTYSGDRTPFSFPPLRDSISTSKETNKNKVDMDKFYKLYYQRALGIKNDKLKQISTNNDFLDPTNMIDEWLCTISWVFKYYSEGIESVNTDWSYNYNYTPLLKDVASFLENKRPDEWFSITLRSSVPKPYEQLLAVLPPESKNLLPEKLQHLVSHNNSELGDMFPTGFLADFGNKIKDHESVALLPYIEPQRIRDVIDKMDIKDVNNQLERDYYFNVLTF